MKMGGSFFWGLFFILMGLGLVIKVVFNIDFPLFKFLIAFFLIFLGIKILLGNFGFGRFSHPKEDDVVFGERYHSSVENGKDYNVIFGKAVFDLTDVEVNECPTKVKISTVFGGVRVKVKKETPLEIKVDAAFAGAHLPNGNSAAFGTSYYTSPGLDKTQNYLLIEADVVFGGVDVIYN
jgi:hypothetical protein